MPGHVPGFFYLEKIMGTITIITNGSFDNDKLIFNAETHGHAHAVNEAIAYLTALMGESIANDHRLHEQDQKPREGFGRSNLPRCEHNRKMNEYCNPCGRINSND